MTAPAKLPYVNICPECVGIRGEHDSDCSRPEPQRCVACDEPLTDEARCANCGRHT